ncbi:S-adenosyl-L-methionine-dependent methyltransferase [Nemania diffusa]|nr:S-adenosyl-L-methionine-dependent methyltransferase [Nemania diffusa]
MSSVGDRESVTPPAVLGFSYSHGVNWSNYQAYRPIYPRSFFQRIYDYHSAKQGAGWSIAHEVGAGCGIVSAALAERFDRVVVSDPNDGYTTLARDLLVEKARLPEAKFTFLQERGEESSLQSGTVDMIAACECIQWMNLSQAVEEFARELVQGGTAAITYYSRPIIEGNERANKAWVAIIAAVVANGQTEVYANVYKVGHSALDCVGFPSEKWGGVKRIYINSQLGYDVFKLDHNVGDSQVKVGEEQIWEEEEDEDWIQMRGLQWFQGFVATWVPRIMMSQIQELWDEFELALGGEEVKTKIPLVMVFATKV